MRRLQTQFLSSQFRVLSCDNVFTLLPRISHSNICRRNRTRMVTNTARSPLFESPRHLQTSDNRRGRRDSDQQSFFAGQPLGHAVGLFGRDADVFIGQRRVINLLG